MTRCEPSSLLLFLTGTVHAESLATPIAAGNIDPAAFTESVDGKTQKVAKETPTIVVWTDKTQPSHAGLAFGASKTPGVRHLRVGFEKAIPVGSILVRSGGQVSVLRPDAAYPGDPLDDSQWLAADRIDAGRLTRDEVGKDRYALWILPAITPTRSIRFTHTARVTDREYAGWLGGAYVLPTRVADPSGPRRSRRQARPRRTPTSSSTGRRMEAGISGRTNRNRPSRSARRRFHRRAPSG